MLMKDRMECVYELFCYGADCNIGDSNGDTPLHWAVQVCMEGVCMGPSVMELTVILETGMETHHCIGLYR